jgi:hypothetical protein
MSRKNIDMDKTIQSLLTTYGNYVVKVLDFDGSRIASEKFFTPAEKTQVVEGYYRTRQSYEFLRKVIKNPTKYLYYPYGIAYNGLDDDDTPGVHYGTPTVSEKLKDVEQLVRARTGLSVIDQLSEGISYHVMATMYKPGDQWIYYGGKDDCAAQTILKLNKQVQLMDKTNFERVFMCMAPARWFAASYNVRGGK